MSEALHRRTALGLGAAVTILYLVTAPAIPNLDGLGYLKLLPHNFAAGHLLYMPALRALVLPTGALWSLRLAWLQLPDCAPPARVAATAAFAIAVAAIVGAWSLLFFRWS